MSSRGDSLFTSERWAKDCAVVINLLDSDITTNISDISILKTGWVPASETWTYASATTITVPSDATTKYSVGDKIKLTQTTVKYFFIVAVASTTLTITGGSDYTLVNAAITDNYYSHSESPVGFPGKFNYTPTFAGFSADPTVGANFSIRGTNCRVNIWHTANGTSNATTFTISAPVTCTNSSGGPGFYLVSGGQAVDNGVASYTLSVVIQKNTASFTLGWLPGVGWTALGSKGASFSIEYQI